MGAAKNSVKDSSLGVLCAGGIYPRGIQRLDCALAVVSRFPQSLAKLVRGSVCGFDFDGVSL